MRAILTQIRAAVLRRRAQTATVLLVSLLAGSVATMGITLLVRSTQPWDEAFDRYEGAHLIFQFDASEVSAEQLAATGSLNGVTAAGPPRETVVVAFARGRDKGRLQLIGRDNPGGALDRMPVRAGRWPQAKGEIAVTRTEDSSFPFRPRLGDTIQALTTHGTVDFKVVGEVINLGGHEAGTDFTNGIPGAWVLPGEIAAFVERLGAPLGYEMAYRFRHAATSDELAANRRLIEAALPAGAKPTSVADWLRMREGSIWLIAILSSIILSFTVFALFALTVIVGSVVAGSVVASYRDIGISKALGFTPGQVVAVFTGQMLVPAVLGALLGVPLGMVASRPLLDFSTDALQLPRSAVFDPVVAVAVPVGLAVLVLAAALVPSFRAAMTDSVRAIALGTTPPSARKSRLAKLLARVGAPRPLSLGAGDAFARPVRGLLTLLALTIGIATATFAIGFQDNLMRLLTEARTSYGYGQDVIVSRYPGLSDDKLSTQLAEQPGTRIVLAEKILAIRVPGRKDPTTLYAMRGDTNAFGYGAARGRWFEHPGEAVVSANIARDAHVQIGESISGSLVGGPPLTLRIVGFFNDFSAAGGTVRIGWETLAVAIPGVAPDEYLVKLAPGSDATAYAQQVAGLSPASLAAHATALNQVSSYTNVMTLMVASFALVLLMISAAGVFNSTLLTTREKVRDISILKALGMTSRQIALMAVGSILVLATLAAAIGLPLGIWLAGAVWDSIFRLFGVVFPTFGPAPLPLLMALFVAFALALLGAALPARWAAATPVAQVLRTE
ncbi:MAG: hypothetical protein NVS9B11_16530 [Candidatus Dormibacteraceae bacterium]